jgi:hypothetical protein
MRQFKKPLTSIKNPKKVKPEEVSCRQDTTVAVMPGTVKMPVSAELPALEQSALPMAF